MAPPRGSRKRCGRTVAPAAVRRQAGGSPGAAACVLPCDPILREASCQSLAARPLPDRVVPALHHIKEGRMVRSSREAAVKPRPASAANGKTVRNGKSAADARKDLLERDGRKRDGASQWRSDPLADAQAARRVADLAQAHAPELSRRGLTAAYTEAARRLADEIEDHLQALPAAAVTARGRSREERSEEH